MSWHSYPAMRHALKTQSCRKQNIVRVVIYYRQYLFRTSEKSASTQGRNKQLKSGGASHLIAMLSWKIQNGFCSFSLKNRRCACIPDTPSSYDLVYQLIVVGLVEFF